jgi:hypothetical protein
LGEKSIKTTKLCETNPISGKPKINLTHYSTNRYDNNSGLLTMQKRSQTNPIYGEPVEPSNPTCGEPVEPILPNVVEKSA